MTSTLYAKDSDGSVVAVLAAALGGLELTVEPAPANAAATPTYGAAVGFDAVAKVAADANLPAGSSAVLEILRRRLHAPAVAVAATLAHRAPFDPAAHEANMAEIFGALEALEAAIAPNDERPTLADAWACALLHPLMAKALDAPARSRFPKTAALFASVAAHPKIESVLGRAVLLDGAVTLPKPSDVPASGGGSNKASSSAGGGSRRRAPPAETLGPPRGSPEEIAAAEQAASAQGSAVAALKAAKKAGEVHATDDAIKAAVAELLALKKRHDHLRGVVEKAKAETNTKPAKKEQKKKEKGEQKETGLGMSVSIDEDFGAWYSQVVVAGELIEYYDISGCYILRPWAYAMWEVIKDFFDAEIKKKRVENCYFPLFVSEARLEAEKDHIEDFAPEVAWVTRSGQSDLDVPIAVRPTSETVMYPVFAKWIKSHRDLPMKLNQWCNVVRWEFKHPTPFIRSREFLWQEGHTAFTNKAEADAEVREILELYRRVYEELLAVPVIPGVKSEKEKFAGGLYTTTVEAFVPATGRGIQGATSHCLGQNFAKMFHIEYENKSGGRSMVWQNSWGCTTRTIGVAIMVHGDDKGLVLPPRIAPTQVVVITIPNAKLDEETKRILQDTASDMTVALSAAGVKSKLDDRENYTPGWKYNHWEVKGVPLRVEFGVRDLEAGGCVVVRRDTGAKETVALGDLATRVPAILEEMQAEMFARAKAKRDAAVVTVTSWDGFVAALDEKKMVLTPWCETKESEELVKKRTQADSDGGAAKTLCVPFEQPPLDENTKCFVTGERATAWVVWGRSY